jgi:hypothetical protein
MLLTSRSLLYMVAIQPANEQTEAAQATIKRNNRPEHQESSFEMQKGQKTNPMSFGRG